MELICPELLILKGVAYKPEVSYFPSIIYHIIKKKKTFSEVGQ